MQKSVLWAEDLESHRQPALYYLSEDDDAGVGGPHLICDWNGPPTDFNEIDLDTLGTLKRQDNIQEITEEDQLINSNDEFIDYPNPAADLVKLTDTGQVTTQTQRQNDFDLAECAHLDFLSVPPMTQGLLRHIVKQIKNVKLQQERQKEPPQDKDKTTIVKG